MRIRKKLLLAAVILVALLLVICVLASNYLVNYAIGRGGDGGNRTVALEIPETADDTQRTILEGQIEQKSANEAFLAEHPGETVTITSMDNVRCSGVYYENADSHNWVLALHGYRCTHLNELRLAQPYYDRGYQVVTPDLRACGETEGKYLGMGWLDRRDVLSWIDWIIQQDPAAQIVIHGVSMGAATTMMVSGEETPDQVVAFVEDCGYTSVWDIFSSELKLRFGMPEFPLLYTANLISMAKAGYSFTQASALEQVKKCQKPMLFIHGTADDFIPYEMMDILYQAKPGDNKAQITAPGAGHGDAMYLLGEEYWNQVFAFLEAEV